MPGSLLRGSELLLLLLLLPMLGASSPRLLMVGRPSVVKSPPIDDAMSAIITMTQFNTIVMRMAQLMLHRHLGSVFMVAWV